MQIECNYLYLLKNNLLNKQNIFIFYSMKETNLNFEDLQNIKVTPDYINYLDKKKNESVYKKVVLETTLLNPISENECRQLLKEYFVNENKKNDKKIEIKEENKIKKEEKKKKKNKKKMMLLIKI